MTNAEAIAYFKRHIDLYCVTGICREAEEMAIQALEQQPIVTSTEDNAEMIYPQVEGITPMVVEPIPNVDKEVEKYRKMLKHPVIKHIMDMDEEQEQLDFVQPHKKIPVTLTVSGYDKLIDLANAIESDDSGYWTNKKISSALRNISPVKPQSCEDVISRREAIKKFTYNYKGQRIPDYDYDNWPVQIDIKTVKEMLRELPSVKPQEKIGHWIDIMVGDMPAQACDQCKTFYPLSYTGGGHNYCPNCGAKMVEPQKTKPEISSFYGLRSYVGKGANEWQT